MSFVNCFVNWVIDNFASEAVIDAYFILSDMVDIPVSAADRQMYAEYDNLTMRTVDEHRGHNDPRPTGKQVY